MNIDTDSTPSSSSVVAAFFDLGFRNAGTPLLIASTPVSAAAPWVNERSTRRTSAMPVKASPSASRCRSALSARTSSPSSSDAGEPPDHHGPDGDHERVDRDGEGGARLPDPAQVHRREQGDRHDGEQHLVLGDQRDQRADVRRRRRDRHRDGQRVVDEQRAGHRQPGVTAEVDRRHLVVAAARGVGVHVLPVARDHREQHDHDREPDPRRERVGRHARDGQGEEDLLGRVGDRRHGVGREDRQRDPLRQQGVREPVAALGTPDQDALHRDGELGHDRKPMPRRSRCPASRARRDSVQYEAGRISACTSW